jgi:hypothetical protein
MSAPEPAAARLLVPPGPPGPLHTFHEEIPDVLTIYFACAALGGSIALLQLVLGMFGFGGDELDTADGADALDAADGADAGLHLFSVRALSGFVLMFGLVGWAGTSAGWSEPVVALAAFLAGSSMLVLIAWILSLQQKLYSTGNLVPSDAVGEVARVYLRIPGASAGQGKITVAIGGRTAEYSAITAGSDIPTGAEVRVVRMSSPGVFEVELVGSLQT